MKTVKTDGHPETVAYMTAEQLIELAMMECKCPVIAVFMTSWNERLPNNADRMRLLYPLIPKMIRTQDSEELQTRRANMAADWFIRVHTPAWLRLAGLTAPAELLATMPEITDFANVPSLRPMLKAVRAEVVIMGGGAYAAAIWRSAAGTAAYAAAASVAAAGAAVCAAAVGANAWAADDGGNDGGALKLTTEATQLSAVDLVERMCALTEGT